MKLILLCLFLNFLVFPEFVTASDDKFINIVNPIRISEYSSDPQENISSQYEVVKSFDFAATWLLTFDVLQRQDLVELIKTLDEKQEIGVFIEITKNLAEASGILYNESQSWYHASNVFLTGYNKEDRIKLLDTVLESFKKSFGYYPKSVGAWWIDSYSLTYLHKKYGVIANLGLADQYSTDGYRVWGTPWGVPFYANKFHSGMPGPEGNKVDILTIQWAPRDPLNGYYDSYYSTQDYLQTKEQLTVSYFEKLLRLYLKNSNSLGQVTVGLEGDLSPGSYQGEYKNQLNVVKKLEGEGVKVNTMSDLADLVGKRSYANSSLISSIDLLGTNKQSIWYNNEHYRVGLVYNGGSQTTEIVDLRVYPVYFQEPYFISPNAGKDLLINVPSLIDSFSDISEKININSGKLKDVVDDKNGVRIDFERGTIFLQDRSISIEVEGFQLPHAFIRHPLVASISTQNRLVVNTDFVVGENGYTFKSLSEPTMRFIQRKRTIVLVSLGLVGGSALVYWVWKTMKSKRTKIVFTALGIISSSIGLSYWHQNNLETYYVSQAEIEALIKLASKPGGNVLIYDKLCFGCEWQTKHKPAAFENKRDYVSKWSKKSVVQNQEIFETENREVAKKEFNKTGAKYIYVVRYGDYVEKVPFSPGDLGIEKIYSNANSEIWRVE